MLVEVRQVFGGKPDMDLELESFNIFIGLSARMIRSSSVLNEKCVLYESGISHRQFSFVSCFAGNKKQKNKCP